MLSPKNIERLSLYRRILTELKQDGSEFVYSSRLAELSGGNAAQVRRDLMATGYSGNPKLGYSINELILSIDDTLGKSKCCSAILVGVGNLGKALLAYFKNQGAGPAIKGIVDCDKSKIGKKFSGYLCYSIDEIPTLIEETSSRVAILCLPKNEVQEVANKLIKAGIKGFMNFAPIHLDIPDNIFVDYIDMAVSAEKVAYFACRINKNK